MRKVGLSIVVTVLTLGAVLLMALTPVAPVIVALTATALYMGGTGHPLSIPEDTTEYITNYVGNAYSTFVAPSELCGPSCDPVAVYTPEQFPFDTWPWNMTFDQSVQAGLANLDACLRGPQCIVTKPPFDSTGPDSLSDTSYTVFGYSQSATIAAFEKYNLIAHPQPGTTVSMIVMSNPNRPNGGILERFVGAYIPILGVTFSGAMTTNSPDIPGHPEYTITTVDVAHQYDPVSDFPTNPLNLLADLNVLLGFAYFHPEDAYFEADSFELQGQYQDTTYYLAPAKTVPLLMPLEIIPFIGPAIAATLDPPLRVLIEAGYDRTINPGQPTPAKWLYVPNLLKLACDFLVSIPTGWDNGIATLTGNPANRPFGTTAPGPYGVGGPPVDAGSVDPYGPPTPLTLPPHKTALSVTASAETAITSRRPASAAASTRSTGPTARSTGDLTTRRPHAGVAGSARAAAKAGASAPAAARPARASTARPAA
ncbi:MAG: PE-PPE domain-containing protein [Mycobacterium sp.]